MPAVNLHVQDRQSTRCELRGGDHYEFFNKAGELVAVEYFRSLKQPKDDQPAALKWKRARGEGVLVSKCGRFLVLQAGWKKYTLTDRTTGSKTEHRTVYLCKTHAEKINLEN